MKDFGRNQLYNFLQFVLCYYMGTKSSRGQHKVRPVQCHN